jgi:hypothetical protein
LNSSLEHLLTCLTVPLLHSVVHSLNTTAAPDNLAMLFIAISTPAGHSVGLIPFHTAHIMLTPPPPQHTHTHTHTLAPRSSGYNRDHQHSPLQAELVSASVRSTHVRCDFQRDGCTTTSTPLRFICTLRSCEWVCQQGGRACNSTAHASHFVFISPHTHVFMSDCPPFYSALVQPSYSPPRSRVHVSHDAQHLYGCACSCAALHS